MLWYFDWGVCRWWYFDWGGPGPPGPPWLRLCNPVQRTENFKNIAICSLLTAHLKRANALSAVFHLACDRYADISVYVMQVVHKVSIKNLRNFLQKLFLFFFDITTFGVLIEEFFVTVMSIAVKAFENLNSA